MNIVEKAWGTERWLVNSELYCLKQMTLNEGCKCSRHRHPVKDETFYVNSGEMRVITDDGERVLRRGDTIRIKPGQWHQFVGLRLAHFMEVSTHHEDDDCERDPTNLSGKA